MIRFGTTAGLLALFSISGNMCQKDKPVEVVDSGPAIVAPPVDTAPTVITPLEEDAGADAADAAPKKYTGGSTLASRVKECCNQMRQGVALMGNPTEVKGYIGQCDAIASQMAKGGGTPTELAPLKALLAGKPVPGVCRF